ncbi:MAG: hypothetical protein P8H59_02530 [Flavobacteriales bacterium]|nr:hypothetical protein [Flavobacteriales bacterium]MDG1779801.1 hypothetical protein [Flavobacteriales bacterium]MDG2246839.1 hypothetical protein [Flavobacteriales bacterium]
MKVFSLFLAVLFVACTPTEGRIVKERFEDGNEKRVLEYTNGDTLSGTEFQYYSNGFLMATGEYEAGKRIGTWKSFHLDSTNWSQQQYENGLKTGPYHVWHRNGLQRISGNYAAGKEIGKWYFMNEFGDTLQIKDFDQAD